MIYLLVGEPFILYQIWGFSHNAKAISTTRIAGGLFVLLREQGLALTKKAQSLYYKDCAKFQTAADRNRTGTGISTHGILSPGRLPVPPLRHKSDPNRTRTDDLRRDRAAL